MTKPQQKTHGIIIRKTNFSENDVIFDLLTNDGEVLGFFGRGARKIKSKLISVLQIGIVVNITFTTGKNLNYPNEVESDRANNFAFYSKTLDGMKFYSDVIKIAGIIAKDSQTPELFELILNAFHKAENNSTNLTEVYNEFLSQLLEILGYETEVKCFFSGQLIQEKEFFYHIETNRVFSNKNKPKSLDLPQISFDQVFYKNYLQKLFIEHVRQKMKFKF